MEHFFSLLIAVTSWGSLVGAALGGAVYFLLPERFPRIEIGIVLFVISVVFGRIFEAIVLSRKEESARK
jgi:hypothetical protein